MKSKREINTKDPLVLKAFGSRAKKRQIQARFTQEEYMAILHYCGVQIVRGTQGRHSPLSEFMRTVILDRVGYKVTP